MRSQHRSRRKTTGGLYRSARGKRKYELTGFEANTALAETKKKKTRMLGGHYKSKLMASNIVNLTDKSGKVQKTVIKNVSDNPANKHLSRRNIMTKGAIIDTDLGKARVTSRPGQDGVVNAVLI